MRDRDIADQAQQDRALAREMDELHGRRWSTPTLVFVVLVALLLGAITALLALPDEANTTDEVALQRALVQTSVTNDDLQATVEALQADLAAKDAQIAQLQAGDPAAASTASDERSSALDARELALADREAALAEREAAVEAAEAGGAAGIALPDLDDLQLPEISEEDARGVFDRLIERLREIVGVEAPE